MPTLPWIQTPPKGLGFGVGFSGFPARWYYHFVFLRYRIAKPLGV